MVSDKSHMQLKSVEAKLHVCVQAVVQTNIEQVRLCPQFCSLFFAAPALSLQPSAISGGEAGFPVAFVNRDELVVEPEQYRFFIFCAVENSFYARGSVQRPMPLGHLMVRRRTTVPVSKVILASPHCLSASVAGDHCLVTITD